MELIKDRLSHILRAKNLTATQFAELMKIQPSNVSHLLNGRNNPSLDFLIKLKEVFPEYNFDWLIMGKKPITINDPSPLSPEQSVFSFSEDDNKEQELKFDKSNDDDTKILDKQQNINSDKQLDILLNKSNKDPREIIFIFDDNSFEIYHNHTY